MWKYNNTNELYHFGIPGMKWGHRKQKISNFLTKSVDASSQYVKRDIKNFLHTNKTTNKEFIKNNVKKYGKNVSRTVSAAYHGLAIGGSIAAARWFKNYGIKTINELTKGRDVEKWRKNTAYAIISLPIMYYSYDAIKNLRNGINEQKQINEMYHFGIPGMHWGIRKNKQIYSKKRKSNKKIKTSKSKLNKKKILAIGAITTTTVLAAYGANKLLDMKTKADIAKRYPIEKINGLGLDADYAKHYMEQFKKLHS